MESTSAESVRSGSFASVYEDNLDRVYGFVGYRVRSRDEAEDLTQVVFEKAFRAWHRFDPARSSVSTWLLAITRNVLVDHFRRRREALMGDEVVASAIERATDAPDPGSSAELATALAALAPREQTILALRFGADLSGREIADVVGLSTDNVHQILSRSLGRLRAALGDSRGEPSAQGSGVGDPEHREYQQN
jgi:RNA polymerase sigma-70 factor, ECF subfamily